MAHPSLVKAQEIMDRKSEDYNGSADVDPARKEYFPYDVYSYLHMIHTKVKRLESVLLNNNGATNFESAEDSALDLINYAAFFHAYLEQQNNVRD
jgi:hypothetical protein